MTTINIGKWMITDESMITIAAHREDVRLAVAQSKHVPPWGSIERQSEDDRVGYSDIKEILEDNRRIENMKLIFNDSSKTKVNLDNLREYLKADKTDELPYLPTDRDCDDFTDILKGFVKRWDSRLAIGMMLALTRPDTDGDRGYHAFNVVVGLDDKMYMVEPQTDDIMELPKEWEITHVIF